MRTYILTMSDRTIPNYEYVVEKTERAVISCMDMGYDYTMIYGPTPTDRMHEMAAELGVTLEANNATDCCNMSHMIGYNMIANSGEPGVLMEYDGYWLQPLPKEFKPEGCSIYNISASNRGEGFIMTPSAAKLFGDFRRSQKNTYGITDHLVHMKQRYPRGCFGAAQPQYQWMHDAHNHYRMPGFIGGNENGRGEGYHDSVRRLFDEEYGPSNSVW